MHYALLPTSAWFNSSCYNLITVLVNYISPFPQALFRCISLVPLNNPRSLFRKLTLWQDIHFVRFVVIKRPLSRAEQLCSVRSEGESFRAVWGKLWDCRISAAAGEINLKKWENRDHVGMKMAHEWGSSNADPHLSLGGRALRSCQRKESLRSKREISSVCGRHTSVHVHWYIYMGSNQPMLYQTCSCTVWSCVQ